MRRFRQSRCVMDIAKNDQPTIFLQQNIRCLRKKLNLSQEDLGSSIGLNRGNIASYENGTAEPKICNLLKLSNLFRVSIMDLTQRDLSDEKAFETAQSYYQQMSNKEKEVIRRFMQKADEIGEVIYGLHTCHQFKAKSMGDLPKDMQIMMVNFEQLYDAAQALLRNHQALLDFIKCRLK